MAKISNITQLREHAIETIMKLRNGEISTQEAGATSKLYDNVINTCKAQLEHAKMTNQDPHIPFITDSNYIEAKAALYKLPHSK